MDEIDLENDVERIFEPEIEDQETAIRVWRLHKRYRHFNRTKIVLNGLNLKCPAGKLYVMIIKFSEQIELAQRITGTFCMVRENLENLQ